MNVEHRITVTFAICPARVYDGFGSKVAGLQVFVGDQCWHVEALIKGDAWTLLERSLEDFYGLPVAVQQAVSEVLTRALGVPPKDE